MIGTQLDLFGGPPKPPKKITIDEEPEPIIPSEEEANLKSVEPMQQEPEFSMVLEEPPIVEEPEIIETGQVEESPSISEQPDSGVHIQMPVTNTEPALNVVEINGEEQPTQDTFKISGDVDLVEEKEEQIVEADLDETIEEEAIAEAPAETADDVTPTTHDVEVEEQAAVVLNIPADQALYSRQYYTMRETAAMFNVNQSLLRFWENEFDILKPKKNRKGDRYFRPDDIKNLELIYHLLRVRKFTINGAKEHLKSRAKMMDTFEMVQRLEKLKSFLLELKTNL